MDTVAGLKGFLFCFSNSMGFIRDIKKLFIEIGKRLIEIGKLLGTKTTHPTCQKDTHQKDKATQLQRNIDIMTHTVWRSRQVYGGTSKVGELREVGIV